MKLRWLVALGFAAMIVLGAVLLALPVSGVTGRWMPFGDALFTACSTVCITGLTVIDPGTDLSLFGQCVMIALVELGCVGIMTAGTFLLVAIGRRLSLSSEFSLMNAYGTHGVKGLRSLIVWIVASMLAIQSLGAVAIWADSVRGAGSFSEALRDGGAWYRAFFYSVMSFANAGFSLDPGSAAVFADRPVTLFAMAAEVILGGFGFFVIYNICTIRFWRRNLAKRGRLSLHSRVVLSSSAVFLAVAFAVFLLAENGHSLEGMGIGKKASVAFFQAVTPRTCGFTVVPMEATRDVTRFFCEALMFIGAAPGGAGGGIKVTTFIVFLCTVAAVCRGGNETVVLKRTVPPAVVREAFVIFFFAVALVAVSMAVLLATEAGRQGLGFENLLFETVSAVTTTGLTCGDTTRLLSPAGRAVIMACMLFGRLGAISVVLLIGGRDEPASQIRYPKEELVVG